MVRLVSRLTLAVTRLAAFAPRLDAVRDLAGEVATLALFARLTRPLFALMAFPVPRWTDRLVPRIRGPLNDPHEVTGTTTIVRLPCAFSVLCFSRCVQRHQSKPAR